MFEPQVTPSRSGSTPAPSSSAWAQAISAAAKPNCVSRDMTLRALRGLTNSLGSKSTTSPAMGIGCPAVDQAGTGRTPLVPLSTDAHTASAPTPIGETMPMPVMTTSCTAVAAGGVKLTAGNDLQTGVEGRTCQSSIGVGAEQAAQRASRCWPGHWQTDKLRTVAPRRGFRL